MSTRIPYRRPPTRGVMTLAAPVLLGISAVSLTDAASAQEVIAIFPDSVILDVGRDKGVAEGVEALLCAPDDEGACLHRIRVVTVFDETANAKILAGAAQEIRLGFRARFETPPVEPAEAPQPTPATDKEVVFWNDVKDSQDVRELQAYLEEYPDGRFARLARVRIDRLQGPEDSPTPAEAPQPQAGADASGEPPKESFLKDGTVEVRLAKRSLVRYAVPSERTRSLYNPQQVDTTDILACLNKVDSKFATLERKSWRNFSFQRELLKRGIDLTRMAQTVQRGLARSGATTVWTQYFESRESQGLSLALPKGRPGQLLCSTEGLMVAIKVYHPIAR